MRLPSASVRPETHSPSTRPFPTIAGWLAVFLALAAPALGQSISTPLPDYPAWRAACQKLPTNRQLGDQMPPRDVLPIRTYAQFAAALDPFLEHSRTGVLAQANAWLGTPPSRETFFQLDAAYYIQPTTPFQPFSERHEVPAGTRVYFHGDLHGDVHSLLGYLDTLNRDGILDGFRVTSPDVRMIFLGDYTDRGRYGIEVLYTLLRLKIANPSQVLLIRGNHEDVSLVARYGFLAELSSKYGREFDVRRIVRLYDFLPVVLYLASGNHVVQCNHGGLEPGYDPKPLLSAGTNVHYHLLGRLNQKKFLESQPAWLGTLPAVTRRALETGLSDFQPQTPTTPTVLGFMWNDFTVHTSDPQFAVDPGRAYVYGDQAARHVLALASTPNRRVRAIFRGHQHSGELNPLMRRLIASRGVFRHWQTNDLPSQKDAAPDSLRSVLETTPERPIPEGSVWTFNVSPDSVYGAGCGFTFDTAGELRTAVRWEDWRLRILNFTPAARP